jgi:hypothetical protein
MVRNNKTLWMLSLVVAWAVAGIGRQAAPTAASPMRAAETARAGLAAATKAARAWHDDAFLCELWTYGADGGGIARDWDYGFCSKAAGQEVGGRSRDQCGMEDFLHFPDGFRSPGLGVDLRDGTKCAPLPSHFIDSDQAMAEAKRAGFRPGSRDSMELEYTSDKKGVVWRISGGGEPCWVGASEPAERKEPAATLAAKLGLHVVAVDPVYHGDVFYTYGAPDAQKGVARALTLIELRTQNSFWTLYIDRAVIDDAATRSEALAALGVALGYCPALKGRDELVEAIRKTPKTTFDAWGVVLGKVKNWSAPEGTNSEPTRVWLQLGNGIDRTPLIVGGPTRAPQRLTLQLGCRG